MAKLPKLARTRRAERAGIRAVERVADEMGCVWRETADADVGIDGVIEYFDESGLATAKLVAVQAKSGESYTKSEPPFTFYPDEKHVRYWREFPVPVLLILHSEARQKTYWLDVRAELRSSRWDGTKLFVPGAPLFEPSEKNRIFESCGELGDVELPARKILVQLHSSRDSRGVSFLHLFLLGLTDFCRSVWFSMTNYELVQRMIDEDQGLGVGFGDSEYQFVRRYVRFLVGQRLVRYDYSDFALDWSDLKVVPNIYTRLSGRGRALVALLSALASGDSSAAVSDSIVDFGPRAIGGSVVVMEADLVVPALLIKASTIQVFDARVDAFLERQE